MVTAEELVVAIQSEGASETKSEIEGVEGAMQDTAESAGDTAEEVGGLGERISGVMGAAVAALAVGAAGLMSQVPVLGEVMSGLIAVVQALAFQMDGVLRPVLSPVSDAFFALAQMIFEAEGAAGTALGVLSTIASIAAVVGAAMLKFGVAVGTVTAKLAPLIGAIKTAVGVLAGIVAGVSATTAAVAIAAAAIVAFAAAYITNFKGVRDTTNNIIGKIVTTVVNGVTSFVSKAVSVLGNFAAGVRSVLSDVAARFASWAGDLASRAAEWGRNVIDSFLAGIRAAIGKLRDFLSDLGNIGANIGVSVPSVGGGGGGGGNSSSGRPLAFRGSSTGGGNVYLDGRKQTEDTGRYRSDPGRRRGL